jgi:hypothetical protein
MSTHFIFVLSRIVRIRIVRLSRIVQAGEIAPAAISVSDRSRASL